mmetsp:Transcript_16608/g.64866  ORF Transcript_16608/g.64866 Transcript_16608/m.64866 type:complete len:452 (-) Transcript_16608:99-1454(-)
MEPLCEHEPVDGVRLGNGEEEHEQDGGDHEDQHRLGRPLRHVLRLVVLHHPAHPFLHRYEGPVPQQVPRLVRLEVVRHAHLAYLGAGERLEVVNASSLGMDDLDGMGELVHQPERCLCCGIRIPKSNDERPEELKVVDRFTVRDEESLATDSVSLRCSGVRQGLRQRLGRVLVGREGHVAKETLGETNVGADEVVHVDELNARRGQADGEAEKAVTDHLHHARQVPLLSLAVDPSRPDRGSSKGRSAVVEVEAVCAQHELLCLALALRVGVDEAAGIGQALVLVHELSRSVEADVGGARVHHRARRHRERGVEHVPAAAHVHRLHPRLVQLLPPAHSVRAHVEHACRPRRDRLLYVGRLGDVSLDEDDVVAQAPEAGLTHVLHDEALVDVPEVQQDHLLSALPQQLLAQPHSDVAAAPRDREPQAPQVALLLSHPLLSLSLSLSRWLAHSV